MEGGEIKKRIPQRGNAEAKNAVEPGGCLSSVKKKKEIIK